MVHLNTNKQLNILLPNTNQALREVLDTATPKELASLTKGKDLSTLLNDILKQSVDNTTQDKTLLNLLKNNTTFKQLGNFTNNLKDLLQTLKSQDGQNTLVKELENLMSNLKDIKKSDLQTKIQNSGVFLESNIKNSNSDGELKEIFSKDTKALLLQAQSELQKITVPNKQETLQQINKVLLQIDYHQLVSHLSNNSSLYIPYTWEDLEEGTITMKKVKKDKFFTDIELQLKEFGSLELRLGLFEKNQLSMNIKAQSKELKVLIQKALPQLKKSLLDVGITPYNIRFLDEDATLTSAYNSSGNLDIGFEVKA